MGCKVFRIVAFAQHTGQTQVLAPVLQRLNQEPDRFHLTTMGHRHAIPVFSRHQLPFRETAEVFGHVPITYQEAREYLSNTAPDLVCVGTSHPRDILGDMSTLNMLHAAESLGIPTFGLLDHWQGLDRFDNPDNAPNYLGVMDSNLLKRFSSRLPNTQVEVTGHPHLEGIWREATASVFAEKRLRAREIFGFDPEAAIWFIVSQILVDRADPDRRVSFLQPEIEGRDLLETIRQFAESHRARTGRPVEVVCRIHPKEPFRDVKNLNQLTPSQVLKLADLLIGWDSMLLIEGYFSGIPVLSLPHAVDRFRWVDLHELGVAACFSKLDAVENWLVENARGWTVPSVPEGKHAEIILNATERAWKLLGRALTD